MAIKKSELYTSLLASCYELYGGMDASQFKDYVLVLQFVKYITDKYAYILYSPIKIPKRSSFKCIITLKGKDPIGDDIKICVPMSENEPFIAVSNLFTIDTESGPQHQEMKLLKITDSGDVQVLPEEWLLNRLAGKSNGQQNSGITLNIDKIRNSYEGAVGAILTQIKASVEKPVAARVRLLGVGLIQ